MFIKGFDKNLCCRDYQFEIGGIYDTGVKDDELELCSNTVFHFCRSLQQVHNFYKCDNEENRYCEIEVLGALVEDDNKCGSNKIKIIREITGEELNRLKGLERGNNGLFNTGDWNTGDWNTGNWNTGNWNTGDWNTGDWNTGNWNTGNWNTGICNTGDWNTGNWNTGMFNSCNFSNGFFNTKESTVNIFNMDSGMTVSEFINSKYYVALTSTKFTLTEWIEYTDEEKKIDKGKELIGGYLKQYTFYEACANWWNNMTNENKEIIKSIPNFNADIFKEITGIEVQDNE